MLLLAFIITGLSNGCKREMGIVPDEKVKAESKVKAYNPYAVESMQKALSNLMMKDVQLMANNKQKYVHGTMVSSNSTEALAIRKNMTVQESITLAKNTIIPTHYYLKFMPANDTDYAKLKMDSNLMIYPFPLDAAVSQYNGSYRDPEVPAGVPTYQYAAVPVSYVLPNVPCVRLAELYLPNERDTNSRIIVKGAGGSSYSVSGRALANESLCDEPGLPDYSRMMLPPEDCDEDYGGGGPGTGTGAPPGEWRPSGRITMYDEELGQTIGVGGIKVRARRWFTTYTGITNDDGYYYVDGTYTRPANYWLDFERYDFAVIDFVHQSTIEVGGPKIQQPWNVDFTGNNKYYATIFRAAFHYYYGDIHGLRRPPQNGFWQRQLKITAINATSTQSGITNPVHTWFGINDLVSIATLGESTAYTYATTIHELAHASHWDESNWSFAMSASTVSESMAAGIEWYITKMVYPSYKGMWCSPNTNYRNVVMDMIDLYDPYNSWPNFYNNYGFGGNFDLVDSYGIVDIQNAMIHNATTWNEWKTNIKNNYNNATKQHLDALFDAWLNY